MFRAVQTANKPSSIHLLVDNGKTFCGHDPVRNAPNIIVRSTMCKRCFGIDRGRAKWYASKLGVGIIIED